MKLNKVELKKICYEFNSKSNRILQVDFHDFDTVLAMYVDFLDKTDIIAEYIKNCGETELDIEEEFKEIKRHAGGAVFALGSSDEEEVRNVYAILKHCVEKKEPGNSFLFYGYASGGTRQYQDMIKGFNERVTLVLIRHIETFLTKVGIEMGVDEHVTYNVNIENGQFNVANDNATINATLNNGVDFEKLEALLKGVLDNCNGLSEEDTEAVQENLEVIKSELNEPKPKKSLLKTAMIGLKLIKGTTEFSAAVITLVQFVSLFI